MHARHHLDEGPVEPRRNFLRDKSFSVPHLIDPVLALTEALVAHVESSERELLFLSGNVMGSRSVGVIPQDLMSEHVRLFAQRHDSLFQSLQT